MGSQRDVSMKEGNDRHSLVERNESESDLDWSRPQHHSVGAEVSYPEGVDGLEVDNVARCSSSLLAIREKERLLEEQSDDSRLDSHS